MNRRLPVVLTVFASLALAWAPSASAQPPAAGNLSDKHPEHVAETAEGSPSIEESSIDEVRLTREIVERRGGDPAALAQLIQMARQFDEADVAALIDELAAAHLRAGNLDLAAETRLWLAERFPDQPRAREAALWLIRTYASAEIAWAHRPSDDGVKGPGFVLKPQDGTVASQPATPSFAQQQADETPRPASLTYAAFLANGFSHRRPEWNDDPPYVFQRSTIARLAGDDKLAQGWLVKIKHLRADDPWAQAARAESWLAGRRDDRPPLPSLSAAFASSPPHLDGLLDDPCWQNGQAARLTLDAAAAKRRQPLPPPAMVRFAYDDAYFYAAGTLHKSPVVAYIADDRPRPHDADLEPFDRVHIRLDLDRDYATWYEMAVDSRGWTAENCQDDSRWNPQWFVIATQTEDAWSFEAAIPFASLKPPALPQEPAWALHIDRRIPGVASQQWPPNNAPSGPQQLSLLLFEPADDSAPEPTLD